MKKAKRWDDEATKELLELREAGYSYKEIGERLGRSAGAINQKLNEIQGRKKEGQPKRKYTKRKSVEHVAITPTRPMVAFVGTHAEITSAIKELFS